MPDAPNADADKTSTPPWGDDFDAARAWTLVVNLRAEVADEKEAHAATKAERDTLAEEKTAAETAAQEATTAREAAEEATRTASRDLWIERAVRKHGLDDDLVEFLTGDDEEAILAKAERLAGRNKPGKKDEENADAANLSGRPTPALTPAHGGDAPAPFDPDAIADSARAERHGR